MLKSAAIAASLAGVLLAAVPTSAEQASIGSLQGVYKTICQWSVDALAEMPTTKRPGSETRWDVRVKALRESLEDQSVELGRLPVVAKDIKVERNSEGASRPATYTMSPASVPAFSALGLTLMHTGGLVMRSDTYAYMETPVCNLRLTLTDGSGRLAALTANATIEGRGRIDKALFGAYGVTLQMALTEWTVRP